MTRTPSRPLTARRRQSVVAYAMLTPAIVLFAIFMAAPIVYTLVLSFFTTKLNGLGLGEGGRSSIFAGLSNYARTLSDPDFGFSVGRVIVYGALLVPTMLGLALLFALLLDSPRVRGRRFARLAIFLPYAVPAVISSLLWGFLYLRGVSPFSWLADHTGLPFLDLLAPHTVLFGIINIAVWGGTGFNMIVIYTSLRAIPSDVYEAARLDGCSERAIAVRIKIPLVAPALVMTGLFSMIATLQVFAEPMMLRPLSNVIPTTWSPLMTVYRDAFTRGDLNVAAAQSILIALVTFVFSLVLLRSTSSHAFAHEAR